jgi:hypothetical protein
VSHKAYAADSTAGLAAAEEDPPLSRSFLRIFLRRRSITARSDFSERYVFRSSSRLDWIREMRSVESRPESESERIRRCLENQ